MRVGMVGLGKLGLPVARAIASKGHQVFGCDIRPVTDDVVGVVTVQEMAKAADLIFVAIQTPHAERFEGDTRLPGERRDFDYAALQRGMVMLSDQIRAVGRVVPVAVVSTVLPGTMRRGILPLMGPGVRLVYNPSFIAQGTVEQDYLDPEFVLLGVDDPWAAGVVADFYDSLTDAPQVRTSIANAELIKVAYNTFIGLKIVFANTLMEICHKVPDTDIDQVTSALALATRRLISSMYLSGGMGDGGGCHPRDNIALSWLARELNLSYDLFDKVMMARERQTEWLADLVVGEAERRDLPVIVLGKAFKPGINQVTGSPAVLLARLIGERRPVAAYDPYVDDNGLPQLAPSVYVVGTKHPEFATYTFPAGSVVIDPWRYVAPQEGVTVIPVGRGPVA